jgi:GH35 family endo-1,4-beta-xylanase
VNKYVQGDDAVDIMVDSVSLQPLSFEEWNAQRSLSTDRARRSSVKVVSRAADGKPLANATVNISLAKAGFPFGNAMTPEILGNPAYEQWFTSRFTVTTFENAMKWYSTEPTAGHEDYRVADAMLQFAERHGIKVRGHNVFWDDRDSQMAWVKPLDLGQLTEAMQRRIHSVVTRYAGKVIAWDVVNENLHYDFFEYKMGPDASPQIYQQVGRLDGSATLFMNEFNTLEQPGDTKALPTKYAAKMKQIRAFAGNGGLKLAVGLESHFGTPNIPYMRAALDTLSQLGVPIWLTEVDVARGPMQDKYLEDVLREGYAHPSVQGIVMWAAWHARGCYVMCLTDNNFRNLPVGNVVDKLIAEWRTHTKVATTDANGMVEVDLVQGEYNFTVSHPSLKEPAVHAVTVDAPLSSAREKTIDIMLSNQK